MTKEELRRLVRSQKRMYSAPQLQAMSAEAVARLMALPQMAAAKTVMLYYSLPDEVSTHELADRLVERGKVVVLPVVTGGIDGPVQVLKDDKVLGTVLSSRLVELLNCINNGTEYDATVEKIDGAICQVKIAAVR